MKWGDNQVSRAAWAVVETDEEGTVLRQVSGDVWNNLPQTSPTAEYVGLAAAAQLVSERCQTLTGDFMGAQKRQQRGWLDAKGATKAPHLHLMRAAAIESAWANLTIS